MTARQAWQQHITSLLATALDRNGAVLDEVAAALAAAVLAGRAVCAFGAGHSLSLVSEMHRRAGSLKVVRPIWGLPRLLEIADHVLDNAGRPGDAALDVPGLAEPLAPTSTIVGAALIHAAWAGAAELLAAARHAPEVWGSANRGPVAAARPRQAAPEHQQTASSDSRP